MTIQPGLRGLVLRNVKVQTVAEAVALACGLASGAYLSRQLGVEGFGAFNYAFAFIYLFLAINDAGVNTIVVRDVSKDPSRAGEIIGAAIGLRLVVACAVLVLAWVAIWTWPMAPELRVPLTWFALILPLNALNVPGLIFTTAMRFELGAIAIIIWRTTGLLFLVIATAAGFGVAGALIALVISEVVGLAAVYVMAAPLVRFRIHASRALWREQLRSAAPVGASLLLTAIINRIDFVLLEQMASLEDVGLYGAAYRVTSLFEKAPLLLMATLYPVMSQLAATDTARLRVVYRTTVAHLGAIGIPLGIVVTIVAPWLTAFLFGEEYRAAGWALRYLVWATVCLYLALAGGNLLISVGRAKANLVAVTIGAVVNVSATLILIPRYGIAGAAIATAASFAIVMIITITAVERYFADASRKAA